MSLPNSLPHRRFRVKLVQTIRNLLSGQNFEEVLSPLLVSEVNTEPHIEYFRFNRQFLIASPELALKEYLFDIWDKDPKARPQIFQCGPVFRAGISEQGTHHANEFTMLEYYTPCESLAESISLFARFIDDLFHHSGLKSGTAFRQITVSELFYQRTGAPLDFSDRTCLVETLKKFNPHSKTLRDKKATWNDLFFEVYVTALEPWLALQGFVVITNFPQSVTSMARPSRELPLTVERFEVLYNGMELCNGYMETFDPFLLRQQMEIDRRAMIQDRPLPERWLQRVEANWDRHRAHIPQMTGVAVGIERLALMLLQLLEPASRADIRTFLHADDSSGEGSSHS